MRFEPGPHTSLKTLTRTASAFIINEFHNVRDRFYVLRHGESGWTRTPLATPGFGSVSVSPVDAEHSDEVWMTVTDFLTPTSLFRGDVKGGEVELLKQLPSYFDTAGLVIAQNWAVSADGTEIPYFMVHREDLNLDGSHPTLVYGYGGFEVSRGSAYSATVGAAWLERGGVYVHANIRGGGEFGPVCLGGSNGGLLTGNMMVQRRDLWVAVVSAVPLVLGNRAWFVPFWTSQTGVK